MQFLAITHYLDFNQKFEAIAEKADQIKFI